MKRIMLFLTVLLVLPSIVSAENHYVTQSGGGDGSSPGSTWSVADFNNPGNWNSVVNADDGHIGPGDTVYFSGTITAGLLPPGSGSSGNYITLDGYEPGNCDPINAECLGSALIDTPTTFTPPDSKTAWSGTSNTGLNTAIVIENKDYLTVQDFRIKECNGGIYVKGEPDGAGESDYIQIKRNYIDTVFNGAIIFVGNYFGGSGSNHIVVGGSPSDGNLVHNAGYTVDYSWRDPWATEIRKVTDAEFSYNLIYCDGEGMHYANNGLEVGDSHDVLIQYNEIYGMNQESAIAIKEWGDNSNIIVRFNKLHDIPVGGNGVHIAWENTHHIYVYGNKIYNIVSPGIMLYYYPHDVYIWSNLIHDNQRSGVGITQVGDGDVYVLNNVFSGNAIDTYDQYSDNARQRTGVSIVDGNRPISVVKNNIFYNNRPNPHPSYPYFSQINIFRDPPGNVELEHNQYYHNIGTPTVAWGDWSDCQECLKDISELHVLGHEDNVPQGAVGNPLFTDPSNKIFSLNSGSPAIDKGITIPSSAIPTLTINGKTYGPDQTGEQHIGFDAALHPSTDWSTTPPTVIQASQNDYGSGWERGAYVYTGDEPHDTCSSMGGSCCILPDTCQGTSLGTFSDCSGTCCSEECQTPPADTCTGRGFHCCSECVPGTEHPENDTDCSPQVCCGTCFQEPIQGEYNYSIIKTHYPPVMDGDLSEFSKADSVQITDLQTGTTGTYRLMWDDDALYIAAQFSDITLNTINTENDSSLWRDDSLEMMFDTAHNKGGSISSGDYKFYASPAGVYSDSEAYDMGWDTEVNFAVNYIGTLNDNGNTDTGYAIEMAIPWPWYDWTITQPTFGSVWGINIVLNDRISESQYPTQTQWSGAGLDFNSPDGWNDVLFTVRADTSRNGCVEQQELVPFIDSWKYDSTAYPMREMMEAVSLYYQQCP